MADHLMMFFGPGTIPDNDELVYNAAEEPVFHGDNFTITDDAEYDGLVADPYINPYIKDVETDYSDKSRAELEQMASDAGIQNPGDLEAYPRNGSLAAAIESANAQEGD